MVTRLEVAIRPELPDPRGAAVVRQVRAFLGLELEEARTRDVYRVDAEMSADEAALILEELVDPVLQHGTVGRLEDRGWDSVIHVGFKPGVTDPVGKSARVMVEDTLGRRLGERDAVYTSTLYLLRGADVDAAERIGRELLANPVIETIRTLAYDEWIEAEPDRSVPRIDAETTPETKTVDLSGSDDELMRLSREGLLALSLEEMQAIRDHFLAAGEDPERRRLGLGAAPTDVELECLAQTWSEHCKHKIFNATIRYREPGTEPVVVRSLFKSYIRGATEAVDRAVVGSGEPSWLVSVFHDNAGVVTFDERIHLVYKVETHNSPSALDPYGGAITGIVGVNRDPFGTGRGADLLSNVWGYCFGSPFHEGAVPSGLMHPRRIRDGVHHGVIDGGNQSGIPYGRGWEVFDDRYLGKPLVFCGTVGALPVTIDGRPGEEKYARPGDRVVMCGGRIGADGIHGATFSSAALDESAPVQAVQIGDPITQKRMFDFLLEAREAGLYSAITDNGAGGLSSSVGEMAEATGGARLDLAKAPLKYPGLAPWEILLSEAQERMSLAVPPEKLEAFLELADRRQVEAADLGEFTDDGFFHVLYGDDTVACISMEFLHGGAPELDLEAEWTAPAFEEPAPLELDDYGDVLRQMVGRLNLCSGEAKARHYDHEVKGLTVVKPWIGVRADVPPEGAVFLARHGSFRGYVLSEGINPFLSDIDCEAMAGQVVDEAVRRQIAAGARFDRIALLDNFCWPDPVQSEATPDGRYKLAQLVRACRGLMEATVSVGAPLISGKDSMKNDSVMGGVKISVPPTLLVSAIGQIDDVRRAVTLDFKRPGDRVFLLGRTRDETGASEYLRWRGEHEGAAYEPGQPRPYVGNKAPRFRPDESIPLYRDLATTIAEGLVASAAVPARGGLLLALVRAAMAAELGATIDLDAQAGLGDLSTEAALFAESCGRFLVGVTLDDVDGFRDRLDAHAPTDVGGVREDTRLIVRHGGRVVVDVDVLELKRHYKETLADV